MSENEETKAICSDCAVDMLTDAQRAVAMTQGPALAVAMWFLIMAINEANKHDAFLMHCPFNELHRVVEVMNPIFGKAH